MPTTVRRFGLATLIAWSLTGPAPFAQAPYTNFESPQTNPLRLSADGTRLFAANTADSRLSVFDVSDPSQPILIQEIPVGVEPVSVNPRTADEVWVVNHVSDSVSVVSLALGAVTDTIPVKDEPCDIVFAGSPVRAFVTASRSNQVRIFDPVTHAPVASITLQGLNPRALAASADGMRVYTAFALSGNRTTIVPRASAPPQGPPTNPALPPPPQVGRIVDATDPAWNPSVIRYTVLDHDVAEINAQTLSLTRYYDRAGTIDLGLAVQPGTGDVWVSNIDARNTVRFETSLRGHLVDNRVTRITTGAVPVVTPIDLNPGLNYVQLPNPAALQTALAQPAALVFDPTGTRLYVAAFNSDKVGVLDGQGTVLARIQIGPVSGPTADPRQMRGPRGLALNAAAERLYVQNRISNTISVVDTTAGVEIAEVATGAYDPTPAVILLGRGFLYDAKLSGNGTNSCASCHIDGATDTLAWDLGNPGGTMTTVTDPQTSATFQMHPMKGPMLTQPLIGLAGMAPYHWRGDKPDLNAFNAAFDGLMGGAQIPAPDMQAFSDFMDTITFAPNPNQRLDRTLPANLAGFNPQTGAAQFTATPSPLGGPSCASCHFPPLQLSPRVAQNPPAGGIVAKVPTFRDFYRRWLLFRTTIGAQNITGFGFEHEGALDEISAFAQLNNMRAFFACFDTGTAPAVGYQRTMTAGNATGPGLVADINTLQAQAVVGNCDLIAKGRVNGQIRGFTFAPASGIWRADAASAASPTFTQLQVLALAGNALLTFTGVPAGSGVRMGIDRDLDGVLDGDEVSPAFLAYGSGCAGSGGFIPSLSGLGIPAPGSLISLRLAGGLGGALAYVGAGSGNGTLPLSPACALLIDPLIPGAIFPVPLAGAGPGTGVISVTGRVPPGTPPATVYFQSLIPDVGAASGYSVTNALRIAIE